MTVVGSTRFPILALVLCASGFGQSVSSAFPMDRGTSWVYEGTVASGEDSHEVRLRWRAEVLETTNRGRVRAALIRGDPRDLAWYSDSTKPGCYVFATVEDREFYFQQLKSCVLPQDDLSSLTTAENLLLRLPAQKGDYYGDRPEGRYGWRVDDRREVELSRIKGVPAGQRFIEYMLGYYTNPDHQIAVYVPGIGLTSYLYSHHGTVSEVRMRLL